MSTDLKQIVASVKQPKGGYGKLDEAEGNFDWIEVDKLTIPEYQRIKIVLPNCRKIAANFSWASFGVLCVCKLANGMYAVMDGQHRLIGVLLRGDILTVPCLVFENMEQQEQAESFHEMNTTKASVTIGDKFRAGIIRNDPLYVTANELLETHGLSINRTGCRGSANTKTIDCVSAMISCIRVDEERFRRVWPLIVDLCVGNKIIYQVLTGIFCLEGKLGNESLTSKRLRDRLLSIGYNAIYESIRATCAYRGSGGPDNNAEGILVALNKGLKNKIECRSAIQPQRTKWKSKFERQPEGVS